MREFPAWLTTTLASGYGGLFALGIIGNISVSASIWYKKSGGQQQSSGQTFLTSLVAADLLVSLLCLPSATNAFLLPEWTGADILCPLLAAGQKTAHSASVLSLTLVSLDRYLALRKPKLAPKISSFKFLFISIVWTLAVISAVPIGLMTSVHPAPEITLGMTVCYEKWNGTELRITYYICIAVFIHAIPCCLVITFYSLVAVALQNQNVDNNKIKMKPKHIIIMAPTDTAPGENVSKLLPAQYSDDDSGSGIKMQRLKVPVKKTPQMKASNTLIKPEKSMRNTNTSPSKNIKTIIRAHRRMRPPKLDRGTSLFSVYKGHSINKRKKLGNVLILSSVIFFICWLPYITAIISWAINPSTNTYIILLFCSLIGHTFSTINPIIYWIMNKSVLITVQDICFSQVKCPSACESFSCSPCMKTSWLSRPPNIPWVGNSSTNEDNLGPFNPKYLRPINIRPQNSRVTSQYFH